MSAAVFLLVGCVPAPEPTSFVEEIPIEMQGNWGSGYGQGVFEYTVKRKETSGVNVISYLNVSCPDYDPEYVDHEPDALYGPDWFDVGIYVQFDNRSVAGAFLIVDKYTEYDIDWITADCRACLDGYHAMWSQMRNAKNIAVRSPEGVVKEFPITGIQEVLPEEPCQHIQEIG